MVAGKPSIALVPGAWLSVSSYFPLLECLQDEGYSTAYTNLPSLDPDQPAECSIEEDASHARSKLLEPLIEKGHDVVLLMHSYGCE